MDVFITWADAFRISLQSVSVGVIAFLPKLIIALVLFFVGWAFAGIISKAIQSISKKTKFEHLFEQAGVTGALAKNGVHFSIGKIIGEIVRWSLIVIFLVPTLELLGLSETTALLKAGVIEYIPKIIRAGLALIIAAVIADGMKGAVITAARSVNIKSAVALGSFTKYMIWIFAILIALTALGIASTLIYIIVVGFIGMIAVGGAIAIGIGGKDIAAGMLSRLHDEVRPRQ
ncbi:hypothetical protein A2903_01170 [Candidatus Nomurabacteria bacterium RIFCSPLOWO2_01_FULL_33_17]|uniref:Small-conductance mechanosensitive ion channel n=1 Tax=Candidatus Nomurabacteria bacterium RIFCSPLOWO2_01_FULL_33_17 TaxID=1801764 RepID=A0A1F6WQJ5_9BACT|nr:MAG: hypothetical protein A2903_01170 [Candidatus Nomurabacteria bacterium RIFCSPLOWO2_01_FULL_33_17]